jgi:hypothetical protein
MATLLFTQLSFSEVVGLHELLENAQQPKQIKRIIKSEFEAMESQNLADIEEKPFVLNHSVSRFGGPINFDFEYEIAVSKEFKLGEIKELEREASRLNNQADSIEQEKFLVSFSNRLKNSYHHYCLNRNYVEEFQNRYERISLLYDKKQRAYEEGEIAKTELLQIELEKRTLKSKLNSFLQQVEDEKKALFDLTFFTKNKQLSCIDTYPLKPEFNEDTDIFELTQKAYEKRIDSTKASLQRHSKKIDTVEVSTGYIREVERDVYSVAISIPLNFSTRKSEYERASLMHHSSALTLQHEQIKLKKNHEISILKAKLRRVYHEILSQEGNIDSFKSRLLPLMKKSYTYGESTVVEYLLSQQQLSQKEAELLDKKQGYYKTLFTLYSIMEKR